MAHNQNDSGTKSIKQPNTTLQIKIKIFGMLKACETDGRETICDMVKKMIKERDIHQKANTDFLLFKRMSDDAYINIGTPTGALEEDKTYECTFKHNLKKKTTDMMREYHAEKFNKNWGIKSFCIKLTGLDFDVSYFQKCKNIGMLLVHFFPGETWYAALYRDGRFKESTKDGLVLCSCELLTPDDLEISLTAQASESNAQKALKFKKRKSINDVLPPEVTSLPEPSDQRCDLSGVVKMEPPMIPLKETRVNTENPSSSTLNPPSSTPAAEVIPKNLHTLEGLIIYIKEKLGLEIIRQKDQSEGDEVKLAKRNNDRIFKKHYENFALQYSHRVFLSELEQTIRLMKHSIGAIIAVNISNVEGVCGATCFRIGTKYVITNHHVVQAILIHGIEWSNCHVDFNYDEKEEVGDHVGFAPDPVLFCSEELDYAILELNPPVARQLPSSMVDPKTGFNIAPPGRQLQGGECLSFIGHPGGLKKQIEVSCPIKQEEDIKNHLVLAFQVLSEKEFQEHRAQVHKAVSNPNSVAYDVSGFFEGSSGSPGFLMQEKLLVVLHSRGVPYKGNRNYFAVEEGILMASVVKDVMSKLQLQNRANGEREREILGEIFGERTVNIFYPEKMEIDIE